MKSVTKAKNFIMKLRLDFSINIELQILDQVVTYGLRVASEICNMYKIYFVIKIVSNVIGFYLANSCIKSFYFMLFSVIYLYL